MSVAANARVVSEAGNGAKVDFDFAFKIFDDDDLLVYKATAAGVYTLQTKTTDYSVAYDTDAETGTVTFVTAPVSGGRSVIIGNTPRVQTTAFTRDGATPAETYRDAFDKLVLMVQELQEKVDRCVKAPIVPASPDAIDIPALTDGQYIKAQDNGDGTWSLVCSAT